MQIDFLTNRKKETCLPISFNGVPYPEHVLEGIWDFMAKEIYRTCFHVVSRMVCFMLNVTNACIKVEQVLSVYEGWQKYRLKIKYEYNVLRRDVVLYILSLHVCHVDIKNRRRKQLHCHSLENIP